MALSRAHTTATAQQSSLMWSPVTWATNQLGDRRVGDKTSRLQPTVRHISVNGATEVETTGLQRERLTVRML